jgi:Family of unknown function (DUF6221)
MGRVDDLIAFVAARLAEGEAAAKAAETGTPWHATAGESGPRVTTGPGEDDHWDREVSFAVWICDDEADGCPDANRAMMAEARHIALHDPARALREVEADRKILALLEQDVVDGRERDYEATEILEQVVKIRAERFDSHPDYRPEWKP